MPLDRHVEQYLQQMATAPPLWQISVQEARTGAAMMAKQLRLAGEVEDVYRVENRTIAVDGGEIPVRIYWPSGTGPFAALLWFHGGGFILGDKEGVDPPLRQIVNRTGYVVVSIDYRLAPEYKFPTAVLDGYVALQWLASNAKDLQVDVSRIAVGGDSAGGTIATVVCLMAKERRDPSAFRQVLLYPPVDFVTPRPAIEGLQTGHPLQEETMSYFNRLYFRSEEDYHHAYASPIYADLADLPPALILTAEYDPLCKEGERYAERLKGAGVPVDLTCYKGLIHGFFTLIGVVPRAADAVIEIANWLPKPNF